MLLSFQSHWTAQRLFYLIPIKVSFFKKLTGRPPFGLVGYGFNNAVFTLVCFAHVRLFNLHPRWPSEISATLNSAALPWALQHLLVGKLPAASPVPWKLMLWIMRFSRYLQVPWQIRPLDIFFLFFQACLWGGFLCSVSIMNLPPFAVLECVHSVHPVHRSNHFCLPRASIAVMFRANKPFYRVTALFLLLFIFGEGFFSGMAAAEGTQSPLSTLQETWRHNETWPWGLDPCHLCTNWPTGIKGSHASQTTES